MELNKLVFPTPISSYTHESLNRADFYFPEVLVDK